MDRRNGATPMDYQWDSGHGPVDASSPFLNVSRRSQKESSKKRTHSAFDSPEKSGSQSLRDPVGQSFLFSEKPLPPRPRNAFDPSKFNTPRTTKPEIDFSSGPDTPEDRKRLDIDSDGTPGGRAGSRMPQFAGSSSNSVASRMEEKPPSPKRRESLLVRLFGSPGRGEIQKIPHYSRKSEKIVKKRRAKIAEKRRRRDGDDSESENSGRKERGSGSDEKSGGTANKEPKTSIWSSALTFLESHPHLPHILSFYAQLLFNFFCVAAAIYLIYSFWATIRDDVNEASAVATAEVMAEMAVCARQYNENKCGDEDRRVPALHSVCSVWEECMKRDPKKVGRARVSAQTFARIFNSFVEPISYKAMIFAVLVVFGSLAISNFAFSMFRTKAAAHPPGVGHYPYPPPTPQRYPSNGSLMGGEHGYWTPARPQHLEPGQGPGGRDAQGNPELKSLMY